MSTESIVSLSILGDDDIQLDARVLDQGASVGLIMCHPHPLFSGTMDNKVVTTVMRSARDLGLNTLRFNFRGVGNSTGSHDNGVGEREDVAAAVAYARDSLGWKKIILAGFSFGAGMACLYASEHPEGLAGLFLIAPAVHHFDAPSVLPQEFETWVLMGNEDEVVPFDEVETWTELVVPQPHWFVFEGAGHYFHGRLTDLRTTLKEELAQFEGR
jgi:alpha/beta superfamily hydrolase